MIIMNLTSVHSILMRPTCLLHGTLRIAPSLYKNHWNLTVRYISHSKHIFQNDNLSKNTVDNVIESETKQLAKSPVHELKNDGFRNDIKMYYDRSKMHINNLYSDLYSKYEATFGLNLIQEYHINLQQIEKSILDAYEKRREIQNKLNEVQTKIKDIKFEMEKFPRNSDHYITLFTKEHKMLKHEDNLISELRKEENIERQLLTSFSENVRKSYQIELARRNKQQFVSYIYYIISSSLAIFCYFLGRRNFYYRYQDKMSITSKSTVEDSAALEDFIRTNMETMMKEYSVSSDTIIQKISTMEDEIRSLKYNPTIPAKSDAKGEKQNIVPLEIQTYGPYFLCAFCGYVLWRFFS